MKRLLILLSLLLVPAASLAQVAALPLQQCLQNATQAQVQGLLSSNYLQGIVPSCTVSIFLTGTTTPATYYLTPNGSPQTGPFTASSTGQWLAYAATSQGYDCVLSGGVAPNTYPSPVTITGCLVSGTAGQPSFGCPSPSSGSLNCPGNITSGSDSAKITTNGPTYDVVQYGALGNGVSDDTAAIQLAFTTCWNGGLAPYGGTVQLPGAHTYLISSTINMYDGCTLVGGGPEAFGPPSVVGFGEPVAIQWNNSTTYSTTNTFTAFQVTLNTTYYPASSPQPSGADPGRNLPSRLITVTSSNTLSVGNWVEITGCTGSGMKINNVVGQVVVASGSSFGITFSDPAIAVDTGLTDSCTWKQTMVMMATDANARYNQVTQNILLYSPTVNTVGVNWYDQSRLDSGSNFFNFHVSGKEDFEEYLAAGDLDMGFSQGSRNDGLPAIAGIYARDGTILTLDWMSLSSSNLLGAGAQLMLDDEECGSSPFRVSMHSDNFEIDASIEQGYGAITMLDCPNGTLGYIPQFVLSGDGGGVFCAGGGTAGFNCPALVMSPPNDVALNITGLCGFSMGAGIAPATYQPFVGLPALQRDNMNGTSGHTACINSAPSFWSQGFGQTGTVGTHSSVFQAISDANLSQIWQHKVWASAFLMADIPFTLLPNATTLYVGQIIAPPTYWQGSGSRYALNVVTQAGTTGTPNYGTTLCTVASTTATCSGPTATITATSCSSNVLTVTSSGATFTSNEQIVLTGTAEPQLNGATFLSATGSSSGFTTNWMCNGFTGNASDTGTAGISATVDLGTGQHITIGSVTNKAIGQINASNPFAVTLTLSGSGTVSTPTALTYSAPVLGSEIQLLTKSASAPSTGTWVQGDFVENSAASATGIAGWICTASGTPGTWTQLNLNNVTTGTPTLNQAACVKAVGPPVVMGYCSTVVSTSGACTCN